jgi:hypothetical protein
LLLADLGGQTLPASLQSELLGDLNQHWQQVRERIAVCDARIACTPKPMRDYAPARSSA